MNGGIARRQRGSALMVAMIMIFILSILGISSMRGATLEGRLASNSVQKEITFQAAESAADIVVATDGALEARICMTSVEETQHPTLNYSTAQDTRSVIEYGGRALALGFSLGGPVGARRFVVRGESSIADVSTATEISQGVLLIGAADASGDC